VILVDLAGDEQAAADHGAVGLRDEAELGLVLARRQTPQRLAILGQRIGAVSEERDAPQLGDALDDGGVGVHADN
jgi:hypothetical protein